MYSVLSPSTVFLFPLLLQEHITKQSSKDRQSLFSVNLVWVGSALPSRHPWWSHSRWYRLLYRCLAQRQRWKHPSLRQQPSQWWGEELRNLLDSCLQSWKKEREINCFKDNFDNCPKMQRVWLLKRLILLEHYGCPSFILPRELRMIKVMFLAKWPGH